MRDVERSHIGIIVGSTRPGRRAEAVARWVHGEATAHVNAARFEVLDLADFELPLLDEPRPAAEGDYRNAATRTWARAVSRCDGFVFVTPEYNHSTSAALKNAIDYLFTEWNHKAAGFVSYGVQGGWRASDHLRAVLAELHVADVRTAVGLSLFTDFAGDCVRPAPHHAVALRKMVGEVVVWSDALASVRAR
ncbi:MAG: NADPH-dependent FMN reductase [Nocardioidaceae bacterium]